MIEGTDERPRRRRPKPEPIKRRKTPRTRKLAPERAAAPHASPAPDPVSAAPPPPVAVNGHDDLARDLLHGQHAIARFIGVPVRRAEYMLQKGQIPARRVGTRWIASRARLRAFFMEGEGG
jgi:hypothetical protein